MVVSDSTVPLPSDESPDADGAVSSTDAGRRRAPAGWVREEFVEAMRQLRQAYEAEIRPDEGLRERKKRLMRQQISDTATCMFCERGFDAVRIAEIADEVGVSEKTVYNYFPTKESLVFDREDEQIELLRRCLAERGPDVSPTEAMLGMIEDEVSRFHGIDPRMVPMMLEFSRLVRETPALQTAMRQMTARLIEVATEALAEGAEVDPRDPEPQIAAHALVGLWDVHVSSRRRHIVDGTPPNQIQELVMDDTRRAARLLETGLWSFNSVVQGAKTRNQLADAARAANEARKQVIEALRQARGAWVDVRRAHDEAHATAEGNWIERHAAGEAAERERRKTLKAERQARVATAKAEAKVRAQAKQTTADAKREAQRLRAEAQEVRAAAQRERQEARAEAQQARADAQEARAEAKQAQEQTRAEQQRARAAADGAPVED